MITRRRVLSVACASGIASITPWLRASAQAQVRTTRMLVGFAPGGGPDMAARLITSAMKGYASTIVVENRPGAGGRIALDALKLAPSDGSVLVLTPASMIVLYPHIYRSLNYDPVRDFVPVTTVCSTTIVLTVGPMVPGHVKTVADFVAWCRANPTQATYGSPAAGSMLHFTGVMLAQNAGFEFVHVPYQGATAGMQDLLGGRIAAYFGTLASTLPHVQSQSGRLRALAMTGPERSSILPDVPTLKEAGYPELEIVEWFGVFAPAKTPTDIVYSLSKAIRASLKTGEVKAGLQKLSLDVGGASPEDFAQLVTIDTERWGAIVKAASFKPED